MKKIILVTILVVAAVTPAAPYFIGTTIEDRFRIEHQEMAAEAALSGFDVELIDYQRQLFNATATTRISFMSPEGGERVSLDMLHHIGHTPQLASLVIATVDTELVLSDETKKRLAPLFRGESPLNINTRIFLDGHQEATINSPAASGKLGGKETVALEWKGIQGSAWQAADRDEVSVKVTMPGMVIKPVNTSPQARNETDLSAVSISKESEPSAKVPAQQLELMRINELEYGADMHKGESGMWQGKAKGSMAAFDIKTISATGEAFTMHIDGIDMIGEQDESNGLVKASGVIKSNIISVNGFDLTNATYDAAVENLDAKALRAWELTVSQMVKSKANTANPFEPLIEQLPALVNAHPVIRINDLSVDSPMGRFALKMDSRIAGEWNDMLMQNPAMLATMIKTDLDASVPRNIVVSTLQDKTRSAVHAQNASKERKMSEEEIEKLVQQSVNQTLVGLIGQGYIKENETQLEAHVVYDAGQLTINGMDASPLMGAMMQ